MPASTGTRHPSSQPPHRRRRRRVRPHQPYKAGLGFLRWAPRLVRWAQAEEVELHGSRVANVMLALGTRQRQVQSGIVYASAEQLGEMTNRDPRTIRRAIADLVALGEASPILVTRPNPCDGGRCGYVQRPCPGFHGGKVLDEDGHPTGAATGYSMNPLWIQAARQLSMAPSRAPGRPTRATQAKEREAALRALEQRQAAQEAAEPAPAPQETAEGGDGPLAAALGAVVGRLPARGRGP